MEKSELTLKFRFLSETAPSDAWCRVCRHGWPGWREWFLEKSGKEQATLGVSQRMLRRYLPGMVPILDELSDVVGADEDLQRFLTFWSPPRYLVNCTQLAISDVEGPLLIRNYDLVPELNESTIYRTGWRGRQVIGMVEGMAGLSDGMNDFGLAVSLTFGGRVVRGEGFGIPLVVRYILQFCRDVQDALETLRSIPIHMSYNVTVADRTGAWATVLLAPDRPPIVTQFPWAANHQIGVEWPHHGRLTKSIERAERLDEMLAKGGLSAEQLKTEFTSEPIYSGRYNQGFGTVFTTLYRPAAGQMEIGWRDRQFHKWNFSAPPPADIFVNYSGGTSVGTLAATQLPANDTRRDAFRNRIQTKGAGDWVNLNISDPDPHRLGDTT